MRRKVLSTLLGEENGAGMTFRARAGFVDTGPSGDYRAGGRPVLARR